MDLITLALCKKMISNSISQTGKVFTLKGEVSDLEALPMTNNKPGDIYLIKSREESLVDSYDEYYWHEPDQRWEFLGSTKDYQLPTASKTVLGGVISGSEVTESQLDDYEPSPILRGGIVYHKKVPRVTLEENNTLVFHKN